MATTVCMIFGAIVFLFSLCPILLQTCSLFCRRLVTSYHGLIPMIFLAVGNVFFFSMAVSLCIRAPHVWWVALFPIALNLSLAVMLLGFFNADILYFGRKRLLRLRRIIPHLYDYSAVIGYIFKKEAGVARSRFGANRVVTYEAAVHFADNTLAELSFANEHARKAAHLKQSLEEHGCARNGRVRKKPAKKNG